jgi:hypothetical protein
MAGKSGPAPWPVAGKMTGLRPEEHMKPKLAIGVAILACVAAPAQKNMKDVNTPQEFSDKMIAGANLEIGFGYGTAVEKFQLGNAEEKKAACELLKKTDRVVVEGKMDTEDANSLGAMNYPATVSVTRIQCCFYNKNTGCEKLKYWPNSGP